MKVTPQAPPREFPVGLRSAVIAHVADIDLEPDEMVTFTGSDGHEYDVVRKTWGYYATPSVDRRLPAHGLRAALMRNVDTRHCFVVLVHEDHREAWRSYMLEERQELVFWLDDVAEKDEPMTDGLAQ